MIHKTYVGFNTPLDQIYNDHSKVSKPNGCKLGGKAYTQELVDEGYYAGDEVSIRFQIKSYLINVFKYDYLFLIKNTIAVFILLKVLRLFNVMFFDLLQMWGLLK